MTLARTSDLWWKNAVLYASTSRPSSIGTTTGTATSRD